MINKISGSTIICGIIGDPVIHSVSPAMHNAAFAQTGLDYVYLPFRVKSSVLTDAVKGMKAMNFRGFNVTMPHKVYILPLLNETDKLAARIGAVNTVVNDGGVLKGFNTDATGFMQVLFDKGFNVNGKKIAVIGAGGAARAATFSLVENDAEVTVINRHDELDWAVNLAININQIFNRQVCALELNDDNLTKTLADIEFLVNATSVGMAPDIDNTVVPAHFLKQQLVVYDLVYNPIETRLLREAKQAGAETISGLDMLVIQGVQAFEKWTGKKAPVEIMREAAIQELRRKN
jgi:shikimate dehydrogenase